MDEEYETVIYDNTYILMEDRTESSSMAACYPPITPAEIARNLRDMGHNPKDYLWADVYDGGWVHHVVAWHADVRRTVRRVDIFDDIPDVSYAVMDYYLNGIKKDGSWCAKTAARVMLKGKHPSSKDLTQEELTEELETDRVHITSFGRRWTEEIYGQPVEFEARPRKIKRVSNKKVRRASE